MKKTAKKACVIATVLIIIFSLSTPVSASLASPNPRNYTQPDGTEFQGYCTGDEHFSYSTDKERNIIQKDKDDNVWKYVYKNNGNLTFGPELPNSPKKSKLLSAEDFSEKDTRIQYAALAGNTLTERDINYDAITLSDIPASEKRSSHKEIPVVTIVIGFDDVDYSDDFNWNTGVYNDYTGITKYYYAASAGQFTFVPAKETSVYNGTYNTNIKDTINDGIVHVKLNRSHGNWQNKSDDETTKDMHEAFFSALNESENYIDFDSYDKNGDGLITPQEICILFITAGYETSISNQTPSIWAHRWTFYAESKDGELVSSYYETKNSKKIMDYMAMGERDSDSKYNSPSTICHECGHILGLKDYYKTDYADGPWNKYDVNYLSLMSAGNYGYTDYDNSMLHNFTPTYLDAFSMDKLEWFKPSLITHDGTYQVSSLDSKDGYRSYKIPTMTDGEYFMVENRQYENYDQGLKGPYSTYSATGGLLYWHIDENIYDDYSEDNSVNNSSHRPAIMPVYPESTMSDPNTDYPFWHKSQYEKFHNFKPFDGLYDGNNTTSRLSSGIEINTKDAGSEKMEFSIKFPEAEIETSTLSSDEFDSKGGNLQIKLTGKNFYNTITAQIFDENDKPVNEQWAKKIYTADENSTLKSTEFSFDIPQNNTDKTASYHVKYSLDGGKTFIDKNNLFTVSANNSETAPTKPIESQDSDNSSNKNGGNNTVTGDDMNLSLYIIICLLAAAAAIIVLLIKKKK